MFCPNCGRQNQDDLVFCQFCGRALPRKESGVPIAQNSYTTSPPAEPPVSKTRLSFRAIKAIVTVAMLAILTVAVLLLFYPSALPWNW